MGVAATVQISRISKVCVWTVCVGLAWYGLFVYWRTGITGAYFVDEGIHTFVGWSWGQGQWPYVHIWDHKGPVAYAVALLRTTLGGTGLEALCTQEIILGGLTALLLGGIGFYLWGHYGAAIALPLGVLSWAHQPSSGVTTTPECLTTFFTTAAILAAFAGARCARLGAAAALSLLMGLCIGLAVCTKPNALAGLFVGSFVLLFAGIRRDLRGMAVLACWVALGIILPVVCFAVLFWSVGALGALVDCYITFNSMRGKSMLQQWGLLEMAFMGLKRLYWLQILPVTLAVFASLALTAARGVFSKNQDGPRLRKEEIAVLCWIGVELILLVSNGPYHWHHAYPLTAALALGTTWLILVPVRHEVPSGVMLSVVLFTLIVLPPALALGLAQRGHSYAGVDEESRQIAHVLGELTRPNETIFALGWRGPLVLSLAERRSASRYAFPLPLYAKGYASDERWSEVLGEWRRNGPPAVVLSSTEGLAIAAGERITFDKLLTKLYHPFLLHVIPDETRYPRLEEFKSLLASQYQLNQCGAEWCLLERISRVPSHPAEH